MKGQIDFNIPLAKSKSCESGDKREYTGTTHIKIKSNLKANTGLFKQHCTIAVTLTEFR